MAVYRFSEIGAMHSGFFSAIHRAQVTDVHVDSGTVSVLVEGTDVNIPDMLMPLMSLSVPPKPVDKDGVMDASFDNGALASWGRYIPQEGDMLLIGFDTNGEAYALGYHAVYYKGLDVKDSAKEDRGGIGWGASSGIRLEPGDFDFYSRRNSRLMLTDKAQLSSGPHSLILNKPRGDATLSSDLVITKGGEASEDRHGAVKRFLLATDSDETYIYGIFGSIAQESTDVVRRGLTGVPNGVEMVRESKGEVIDETSFLPMVPATSYPDLSTMTGTGTRRLTSVKDDTSGITEMHLDLIDNLGNRGVSAKTAVAFQWFTPASTWTVLNAVTDWTSSGKVGISAGAELELVSGAAMDISVVGNLNITSEINATIEAVQLALGSATASEYLVKGTTFIPALTTLFTTAGTTFSTMATASVGPLSGYAASFTALATAFSTLATQLNGMLSTKVKTV